MASFSLKTVLSAALLVAHSALAFPTPVEHEPLVARATVTETPAATITPEIIDHGHLDDAALADLVKNRTGGDVGKILPRQNSGTSTNGGFLSYMKGLNMPGTEPKCPEFLVEGPILGLEAAMGSTNIRSLHLTSISGNSTDIKGLENIVDPPPGPFEFSANERVTEFVVYEGGEQVMGFTFKTDAGKEYKALSEGATNPANNVVLNSIPVGSGIIARIRGTSCDVGVLGAFGIDFLDELASIAITNTTYSGFTNNIAPAGDGSFLNVGSQVLDNRNGSVQQQMTLATADAITQTRTITTTSSWFVGGGVTAKASAGLPFIGKTELETTANWQVAGGKDDAELTSQTSTKTATFQLNCPARKYCVGAAVFQVFKLDVNMEATFTAETKSGNKYSWVQKGTYKGSDSLSMKLTVDEVDSI